MKKNKENIKCVVPFCCGGVATYGLEKIGFEVAVCNELDFERARWHKETHKKAEMIYGDIWDKKDEIIKAAIEKGCQVGLFSCPCQPFSLQGGVNLEDPRARLFLPTIDVIRRAGLTAFLYENVPFWVSDKAILDDDPRCIRQRIFDEFKDEFDMVYGIQCGSRFGSAQTRKRSFILGIKKGCGTWKLPEPDPIESTPTFRQVCGKLERLDPGQQGQHPMHYARKLPKWQLDFLKQLPPEKSGWDDDVPMKPKNVSGTDSQAKHKASYSRLYWDKPIGTLTTDASSISGHRTIHPEQNRVLSPLEMMLCCGLDESYPVPRFAYGNDKLIYDIFGECFLPKHLQRILSEIKWS